MLNSLINSIFNFYSFKKNKKGHCRLPKRLDRGEKVYHIKTDKLLFFLHPAQMTLYSL
jgi:hypothetical protein